MLSSKTFLDNIKVRRLIKEQYSSIFAFSREVNIDPSAISRYLAGLSIGMKNARRVAHTLGVLIDEILLTTEQDANVQ